MLKRDRSMISKKTLASLGLAAISAACSSAAPGQAGPRGATTVTPTIAVTSRAKAALTIDSNASLDGTYGAGCTGRAGAWSVAIDGSSRDLDNAPLSVVQNDTGCVLTVTALRTSVTYAATPPIALTDRWQTAGSSFAVSLDDGGPAPVAFYANAMVDSVSFGADFVIDLVYSDDASLVSSSAAATYATVSSHAASADVPAPDYSLDVTGMTIQVDARAVVQNVGGDADLTFNSVAGQTYAVDTTGALSSSPSFAEIDAFYRAQTPTALAGTNPVLPAAGFSLVGATLPATRSLVVADTASGVVSYQLFSVTFNAP